MFISKNKVHAFHFMMDAEMKNRLRKLSMYGKTRGISGLIVSIVSILSPMVNNVHFFGKQKRSRYETVCDDPEIARESTHVYMPGEMYRKLKLMHQDLNYYSIAQLLRRFLLVFLFLVKFYGDDFENKLKELMKQYNRKNEKKMFSHEILLQLLLFIHKKSQILRLFNIYDHKFTPVKIFHL